MNRDEAARSYLGALCAYRDAKRLLMKGFAHATAEPYRVLAKDVAPADLLELTKIVACKEASDLIDLYDREPGSYPEGRTADTAFAAGMRVAKARYARGKCGLCRGPALDCAKRHGKGQGCA